MNTVMRIIGAVITVLIALSMTVFVVIGLANHQWLVALSSAGLAGLFGVFVVDDYKYFFGAKPAPAPTPVPPPPARGQHMPNKDV